MSNCPVGIVVSVNLQPYFLWFSHQNMYTGLYTEEEFRSLGVMATFVTDEMFWKLDRSFFVDGLEFLRRFCYNANKRDLVADMLQEQWTFG